MKNIYIKLLLWIGYKPWKWGVVANTWDGETPPKFGYYPRIVLKKKASFKVLKFEIMSCETEKGAEKIALSIFKEMQS